MAAPATGPQSMAEFTLKAVVAGIVLGIVFGAANAYLGLRVGMTVSASIPAAVMTVAMFKLFRVRGTILEANISQTIGSASTALATGAIFTIPALFLWGMIPPYFQVVALCFLGGVLGLAAMIPLRRLLVVQAHGELPYPEGTACAVVLRATTEGASGSAWIFRGMLVGAALKLMVSLAFLFPNIITTALPVLPKAELALELAPALLGVGFILGYRQSGVLVAGSLVSSIVLIPLIAWIGAGLATPLYPETQQVISEMTTTQIWARSVRYIGAGAVAVAGILTVLRGLPTMVGAFAAVARGMRRSSSALAGEVPETDRDLPGSFVIGTIVFVVAVAALVPGVFAGGMGPLPRAICAAGVGIFGMLFVAVAARIVGIVGVTSQPTSGIDGRRRAGRRAYSRHHRGDCRLQGRRHLAGPEDWISGGGDTGKTTIRPGNRRLVRLLGRGGHGPTPGYGLHFRHEGDPGASSHADEDHHRGRPRRPAALGPRAHGGRSCHCRHSLRRIRTRLRDRGLPAAVLDGDHLYWRLRPGDR
jgi:putative OPT family oligopeptide transporter